MAEDTKDEKATEFDRPFDTRFDRSGRGFPNFAYRLRQIEKRLDRLERTNPGAAAPSTPRERDDEHTRG